MDFLPVFLKLRGRRCLVVGAGDVAQRKVRLLRKAGASIDIVAPQANNDIATLAAAGEVIWRQRVFTAQDVDGAALVIAATANAEINRDVADAAKRAGIVVNVVDQSADSTAIMPSIIDRSPVVIAVGTGGKAPVLARLLRAKIETMISPRYGELASLLGDLRDRVALAIPEQANRRRFWESILEGPAAELLFAGRRQAARTRIESSLTEYRDADRRGEVFLIGTGPGDPDLLTFRALRLMQRADVVVYDRLIGDGIVDLCRRDAERIYVGKARAQHSVPQEEINELLLRLARAGKRVARLKGGDPFMFGRGGEEIEQLAAAGIEFQVVPGITAALGCAAYAGIPLTHRDYAQSCLFVTGHLKDDQLTLDWPSLSRPRQTLVVYMGLASLAQLADKLTEHGLPATTPAAIIERASSSQQRVITTSLEHLAVRAERAACVSPATVIVGEVVSLRDRLKWFEDRDEPAS